MKINWATVATDAGQILGVFGSLGHLPGIPGWVGIVAIGVSTLLGNLVASSSQTGLAPAAPSK
jgi:hypothetical protein